MRVLQVFDPFITLLTIGTVKMEKLTFDTMLSNMKIGIDTIEYNVSNLEDDFGSEGSTSYIYACVVPLQNFMPFQSYSPSDFSIINSFEEVVLPMFR